MKLISKQPQKEFDFTLYRNYKIRSLNSNDLKSYAQNGDFIHIEFNKPIKILILKSNIQVIILIYIQIIKQLYYLDILHGIRWQVKSSCIVCLKNQAIQDMDIIHISEIESVYITYQLKAITLYYAI